MSILTRSDDGRWLYYCPGCDEHHGPTDSWAFNGSQTAPTFSPSVLVQGHKDVPRGADPASGDTRCHHFVRDGQIQFLGDCTHALAGQTVPMEDLDR